MKTDEFFTVASLATLQGASLAAWIVPSVVNSIVAIGKRWRHIISLVVALGISLVVASTNTGDGGKWLIALLNGLLIYASAVGINQLSATAAGGASGGGAGAGRSPFASWI